MTNEIDIIHSFNDFSINFQIPLRNSAHRLSLFIFYWGARSLKTNKFEGLEEPMRVVIITRPKLNLYNAISL